MLGDKDEKTEKKKELAVIIGFVVAILGVGGGYFLLWQEKISGADFVNMFSVSLVIGIVISLLPNVSELSIGNLVLVKLKRERAEAEKIIKKFELLRFATFKLLLILVKRLPGGYRSLEETKDQRIDDFWEVYNLIEDSSTKEELKKEIGEAVDRISKGQIDLLKQLSDDLHQSYPKSYEYELPEKHVLREKALAPESIAKAAERLKQDESKIKVKVMKALDEYGRLKDLVDSLKKA